MELCRFAYLTCQHRELWWTRSPWARGHRLLRGDKHTRLALPERGCPVWVQACPVLTACVLGLTMRGVTLRRFGVLQQWVLRGLVGAGEVEAAVGASLICIAQPRWNIWVPMAILECSLPVGSTNPAQPVDAVGALLSGINPSGFVVQKRWDLNLQVSLDIRQELWAAGEDWHSVSGPVTGIFARRRWNSFNRWICHFPYSGGYGSCFRGEGDVNSWSRDRAEMTCNLSELSSVSVM